MKMMSIASGSSGNCIYIGTDTTHILIDDGISRKRVVEALQKIDVTPSDLNAIFVTHEHSDHIGGLSVLLKKDNIPVYASKGTIGAMRRNPKLSSLNEIQYTELRADEKILIGDILINPFGIYHDAMQPYAYTFESKGRKAGIITDLGHYDDYIIEHLLGLNSILIESNHDVHMVEVGRKYSYSLKLRILGDNGHLSNENSGRLLDRLLNDNFNKVLLGHLSHENNYPDLAFRTVKNEIDLSESKYKSDDFDIQVASQTEASDCFEV